ncbi:ABC transporter ATP-binding protein [Metasolibacillus meyeri]|uniref:ABC transporter ATP-binding protein n=1 Tax=Metasolibacillus meyeri TaxID=1071052 RepID=A0AAW9NMF4_9BACL|nr:ABC transporter ATP-binding protein [Metasolibacillus meyeri]MEC1178597.1 ABC transporter ATP-binding protein [Metasolibacillus meyeri]
MKTVFSYVKPYKWPAIIALILMLIELFVELAQPLIMAKIVDDGILAQDGQAIWYWGLVMFALSILALVVGITNSYFASHAAQSFSYDLRNALFSRIQSFTMATYLKFPTSSLITRLTSDITQVQNVFFMSLRIMLRAPLAVVGSMVMAFIVNAKIAMFLMIGAPILVIFLAIMVKRGVAYFSKVQGRLDRVNRVLQESLQAMRLVKAYMRGHYEASRFNKVAEALKIDTVKALRTMELIMPILLLIMNLSLLAVLWFGANEVNNSNAQVGDLIAIVNYAMRMTGSFSMFAFIIIAFARAKASSERMEEILLVEDGLEVRTGQALEFNESELGTVRFENVSFAYNAKQNVIHNVSFDVKQGEKLAIMGATGAGKSTLLNLIPRFYEATDGRVFVNGRDVKAWDLDDLRAMIGFVPQQSLLFTGSILENVSWGKVDASLTEVEAAATQAQIHESVESFPNAYETRVGQKGVNLSGGQKQRLSIARALIRKSQILILDDSTSALDVKTEAALWDALEEERATMLVVTQKIRTARGADRILLLDVGRVVGFGSHDELLQTSELYKKIAQSQQEQGDEL